MQLQKVAYFSTHRNCCVYTIYTLTNAWFDSMDFSYSTLENRMSCIMESALCAIGIILELYFRRNFWKDVSFLWKIFKTNVLIISEPHINFFCEFIWWLSVTFEGIVRKTIKLAPVEILEKILEGLPGFSKETLKWISWNIMALAQWRNLWGDSRKNLWKIGGAILEEFSGDGVHILFIFQKNIL